LAFIGAFIANGLIVVLKFIAALITVSAGMTARVSALVQEHNESVFLLPGLHCYQRPASENVLSVTAVS
jgi:hypothetical protein